jgi:hypothetical protein
LLDYFSTTRNVIWSFDLNIFVNQIEFSNGFFNPKLSISESYQNDSENDYFQGSSSFENNGSKPLENNNSKETKLDKFNKAQEENIKNLDLLNGFKFIIYDESGLLEYDNFSYDESSLTRINLI